LDVPENTEKNRQIKNTDNTQIKYNSEKQTTQNTAKQNYPEGWFSRLLRHSVSKRGRLILQRFRAHTVS